MELNVVSCLFAARATGNFFQINQPCYYGESVLNFAASTKQKALVQWLVQQGADISAQDSHGNTILHVCVIHSLKEMYEFCLNLSRSIAKTGEKLLDRVVNNDGLYINFILLLIW